MALVPQYQCVPGALTQDFLGTIMDKVIALSNYTDAISFLADNWEELQTIHQNAAVITAQLTEALAAADTVVELEAIIQGVWSDIQATRNAVDATALVVQNNSNAVATATSTVMAANNVVHSAKIEVLAAQENIETLLKDLKVNTVNLDLGERFVSSATLTYGARF